MPHTLVLALYRTAQSKKKGGEGTSFSFKSVFPFFILYFIAAAVLTTIMGVIPESGLTALYIGSFIPAMKWLAKFFIAMAMCAIGLNTNLVNLIKKGGKPIIMGFCCWVCITAMSLFVQYVTGIFYTNL